ncbi:MAG: hypothetical protein IIX02_06260 [Clostridia bacterium]|nr:hypothetical protein [Clostridia bacterium]
MKKTIDIIIKDKIAKLADLNAFIVCGNDNYEINFIFDEEWAEYEEKTVYFIANGVTLPPVVIQGNKCDVPALSNTAMLSVGVSAGDIRTTTDAVVSCRKSIRCKCGAPVAPTPEVYDQIMQMINDGKIKGETGEKGEKGDKGDAGVIKFIPVAELPTENIEAGVVYLVPLENPENENRYAEYVYVEGAWEKWGEITVQVDHSEYVKFTDFDEQTIESLTDNARTLTGEEKAAACGTIGAIAKDTTITTYRQVYVKNEDGTQTMIDIGDNLRGVISLPFRLANGHINVPITPSANTYATSKKYVDDLIAELRAEIAALKGV